MPTTCSTRPTRPACATSTPRAPTAAARRSWPRGSTPRAVARRRHRRLEVGLHVHRGLAHRRRRARGQGPLRRDAPPPARRDARAARRAPRALPDPLGDARERRARRRGRARRARAPARRRASRRAHATGPRQADTIERALEVGGFDAVQATWNLLERSATAALAAAHDAGLGVIVKEALANGRLDRARRHEGPLAGAAASAARRPTRWRSPRSSPSRGSTSPSAAPRPSTPCAATSRRSTWPGTRSSRSAWRGWPSRPMPTGSAARELAWN